PWARWQETQAAVKLNVLFSVEEELPELCSIVTANEHDVNSLKTLTFAAGHYYVFDRGYPDFASWFRINQSGAWFVTRLKRCVKFRVKESRKVDKTTGLRCDQTIELKGKKGSKRYTLPLRRIRYCDIETGNMLVFASNNFALPALTITAIYKKRWEIELFFRWMKQHLRLRKFFCRDINGVRSQVWSAICAYLLIAIAKKELNLSESLYTLQEVFAVSIFQRVPISELLANPAIRKTQPEEDNLLLFNEL
ncbi:MAG: IS4 family transposase, partial [Opitutaceae bacterium]|nr:IS4 family transposase [Opitutaceae bacterium]